MHITIVLATYNRAPLLRKALESLVQLETGGKFSYDILVIDDGSTDQTAAVVQEVSNSASGVSIIYVFQKTAGRSSARNTGIERSRGNWLAFFDDDQWAEPGWLAELYSTAQTREADCVGGAVCLDLPESVLQELGVRTRGLLAEKSLTGKAVGRAVKDNIGSGNVLLRRAVFQRLGGFDTSFRRGEDTDFFWRIEQAGFRLCYAPQAIIHHVISTSRLQPSYWRWLCFEQGVASARIRWQHQGALGLVRSNLWRLGVTLGRDLPLLTIAGIASDRPLFLDSLCSLWYTISFMRSTLFFLAPRSFPQKKFLSSFGFPIPGGVIEWKK